MSDDKTELETLQDIVDSWGLEKVVNQLVTIAEEKEAHFNSRNTFPDDKEARQWHRAVVALDKALIDIDI